MYSFIECSVTNCVKCTELGICEVCENSFKPSSDGLFCEPSGLSVGIIALLGKFMYTFLYE